MSEFSVSILHGGTVNDGRNLKDATLLRCFNREHPRLLEPLWNHDGKEVVISGGHPYLWRFEALIFPFDHFEIDPSEFNINDTDDIWVEAWREF